MPVCSLKIYFILLSSYLLFWPISNSSVTIPILGVPLPINKWLSCVLLPWISWPIFMCLTYRCVLFPIIDYFHLSLCAFTYPFVLLPTLVCLFLFLCAFTYLCMLLPILVCLYLCLWAFTYPCVLLPILCIRGAFTYHCVPLPILVCPYLSFCGFPYPCVPIPILVCFYISLCAYLSLCAFTYPYVTLPVKLNALTSSSDTMLEHQQNTIKNTNNYFQQKLLLIKTTY